MSNGPAEGRRPVATLNGHGKDGSAMPSSGGQQDPATAPQRYNLDHERAAIGCLLHCGDDWATIDEIFEYLTGGAETFYSPVHIRIFRILQRMRKDQLPFGSLQVVAQMNAEDYERTQNGTYLTTCMELGYAKASGGYYANLVAKAYRLREEWKLTTRSQQRITSVPLEDGDQAIEANRRDALTLPNPRGTRSMLTWKELAERALDRALEVEKTTEAAPVAFSGWAELDQMIGGFRPGKLYVICARPGMGKTVCGLNIAQHVAMRQGLPFAWFSLEMDADECADRLLCAGAGVHYERLRDGTMTDEDWTRAIRYANDTEGAPLGVDDTATMTMSYIRNTAAAFARSHSGPIGGIAIDYLGRIKPEHDPRGTFDSQNHVAQTIGAAKDMARELQVPVFMLAQLNRENAGRSDKRPQLTDLRGSGAIEQDADVVIGIHREDYYDKESPASGEVELIVLKHRGGRTDTVTLAAQLHVARFASMAFDG